MTNSLRTTGIRGMCRTCMVSCGVFMEVEDGRVVRLIGDKDDPASHGYTCSKGRDIATHLYGPNRLLRPLRKAPDGAFEAIAPRESEPLGG